MVKKDMKKETCLLKMLKTKKSRRVAKDNWTNLIFGKNPGQTEERR